MRCFISLNFDDCTIEKLNGIQQKVKNRSYKGTWVWKENFHLTLKFLGEVESNNINEISNILKEISQRYEPFKLNFNKLGYFKGKEDLKVIWVGLDGEIGILNSINNSIENKLETLGFSREKRKFLPHITLGRRVVFENSINVIDEISKKDVEYSFMVNKIFLMKSDQVMNKRVYTPIEFYNFEKKDHR